MLSSGKLMQFIPQDGVYTYFRYTDAGECVMVIANNTKDAKQVDGSRFAERTAGFSLRPGRGDRGPGARPENPGRARPHGAWWSN
ncbi:MAG: cyclomaltodextrinase C-terminal domain-containing protein [Hymenobacter sp.]